MENSISILDRHGKPLPTVRRRGAMLAPGSNAPYDAADQNGGHVRDWHPYLGSPDGEVNMYRDRLAARSRDLIRNDGWATAAVMRTVDNVIGPDFRPISKPDYRWLRTVTGIKA